LVGVERSVANQIDISQAKSNAFIGRAGVRGGFLPNIISM
jgi:hypothetical protein